MPRAVVLVVDGVEEIEAVATIDVLRRANVDVCVARLLSLGDLPDAPVLCSRGVRILSDTTADVALADLVSQTTMAAHQTRGTENLGRAAAPDVIVLPGGMGAARAFAASTLVKTAIGSQLAQGKLVACICAAPVALVDVPEARGARLTSHPAVQAELTAAGFEYIDIARPPNPEQSPVAEVMHGVCEPHVVIGCCGKLITSRGPGTSIAFALAIVESLCGKEKRLDVAAPMMIL